MIALTKRQRELVELLMGLGETVSIKQIAQQFSVSSRTVRYDLDAVEEWLEETGAVLTRVSGKGVHLQLDDYNERLKIIRELRNLESEDAVLTAEERRQVIFFELLRAMEPLKLEQLAERLYVSKNTVIKDIAALESSLSSCGLYIKRGPLYGFEIHGSEKALRVYAVKILQQLMDMDLFARQRRLSGDVLFAPMLYFVSASELSFLDAALTSAEKHMQLEFADTSYANLLLHLAVSIFRVRRNSEITLSTNQLEKIRGSEKYQASLQIMSGLEQELNLRFSEHEVAYFALHLSGAKVFKGSLAGDRSELPDEERLNYLVDQIIEATEGQLGVNLREDPQLAVGLAYHLKIALHRIRNDLPINNPLTEQMRFRYPFIFDICQRIGAFMEKETGLAVNDDEIAYLAMHIGAAYERSMQEGFMPKALVVCSSGIATSQLLVTRLKGLLPELQLVGPVSLSEVNTALSNHEVNFIISTVDLHRDGIETITVNPLIDEEDLNKLRKKIFRITSVKRLFYLSGGSVEKQLRGGDPMLIDLLTEEQIRLGVKVSNWEEAVRCAGTILENKGFVEPCYTQAMIDAVKKLGPYMVIMPGVALAHARPEDGVNKICMSLVTFKEPVSFGRTQNDPVKIIIGFGAVDHTTHLQALSELARVLEHEDNVDAICHAGDYKKVLDVIRKHSGEGE